MNTLTNPLVISILFTLIVFLFAYAFLVPRNTDSFSPQILETTDKKSAGLRAMSRVGNEMYLTLPSGVKKSKMGNPRIEALLVQSGNPWNFTAEEFGFFRYVTAFVGFFGGWIAFFLINDIVGIPWWVLITATTIFGYFVPVLRYRDQVKKRDLEFKRQLPEALDLIIISLTGGRTFTQALRESLPNMSDGVLKREFAEMSKQMDTGKTTNQALEHFANRAPNEGIKTFVQSVREANQLDTPLAAVLQARAEASREEFFAMVSAKTASLSSKMMAILTPTLIPALLIISLAPAISSFSSLAGG